MKREHIAAAVAAVGMGLSGAALAQTPAASGELTLEEVVVTAERREENLQKVAATVTAISSERLQEEGVRDITDLTRVAPQIVVQQGVFNNISQRGISTGSFSPVSEGTTAVHLDGAYISRFTGLNGITFDTQRVEVVDGPQGTLYGRNATAGTINFITNRPGDSFGGNASLEVGAYRQLTAQAALNLPLTETLKSRVAFYHTSSDGVYSSGLSDSLIDSVRVSTLWKPTDRDQLVVSFTGVRVGGQGGGGGAVIDRWIKTPTIVLTNSTGVVQFTQPATANGSPCAAAGTTCIPFMPVAASDPWDDKPSSGWDSRAKVNTRNNALIAQYEHSFDFATLSLSASQQSTSTLNITGSATGYLHGAMAYTAGWMRPGGPGFQSFKSEWESYEAHLASKTEGQLSWIGGVYHFHEVGTNNLGPTASYATCFPLSSANTVNPANAGYCPPSVPVGTAPTVANGNVSPYGQMYMFRDVNGNPIVNQAVANILSTTSADALFGQVTWTPTFLSRAHLTAGARYNKEERAGFGYNIINRAINPLFSWNTGGTWNRVTYKANLAYDVTDRIMVYADRSTGFKSGGVGYGPVAVYDPELLEAWELGLKSRFFNDKLQVNVAGWYYNFTNRQLNGTDYVYDPTADTATATTRGSAGAQSLINAGKANSKGQSLDVTWVITPNDRLRGNVQHVESFYTDYDLSARQTALHQNNWCTATANGAPNGPGGTCTGLNYYDPTNADPVVRNARFLNLVPVGNSPVQTGTRLNATRPWSGNVSYTHTFRLSASTVETTLSAQYQGTIDKTGAVGSNGYLIKQPSYQSHDLNVRYRPDDSNWDLLFSVRNFEDREIKTGVGFTSNAQNVANYLDPNAVARANYAYWTANYASPRTYGVSINARF